MTRANLVRALSLSLFSFLGFFSSTASADPVFASKTYKQVFISGQTSTIKLRDLLQVPNDPETLTWGASSAPSWVSLPKGSETMTVTAPATKTAATTFTVTVCAPPLPGNTERCDIGQFIFSASRLPVWTSTALGKINEGTALNVDLTKMASQPDGEAVTFTIQDPKTNAAWVVPSGSTLGGTPQRANVGSYDLMGVVTSSVTGFSSVPTKLTGTVVKVPKPPKFLVNPITFPGATEGIDYNQSITSNPAWISNPEGSALTFSATAGKPTWLTVGTDGKFTGKPGHKDSTSVSVTLQLSSIIDGVTYTDSTVVQFPVTIVYHPPVWSINPIVLPDAPANLTYTQDISSYASDVDGDSLSFTLISGPSWAKISTKGVITGTPAHTDPSPSIFTVQVSDGSLVATTSVQVKITNAAPVWSANPIVMPSAKQDSDYTASVASFASDLNKDPLTYSFVSGSPWIRVALDGTITGKPTRSDVGLSRAQVQVSDGFGGTAVTEIQITVNKVDYPPKWDSTTITLSDAYERSDYQDTVATHVTNPNGNATTFTKTSATPAWVSVASDGTVTGKPQRINVGVNSFTVRATDAVNGLTSDVTVIINVIKVPLPPTWKQDPITLADAMATKSYSFDLTPYVNNPDNSPLTFGIQAGPSWQGIDPSTGKLNGTPAMGDIGNYNAIYTVTDGKSTPAPVNANGKVITPLKPPTWVQDPLILPDATVGARFNFDLFPYVNNPDGRPLTFSILSGPTWLSITPGTSTLTGIPQVGDVGIYSAVFNVNDTQYDVPVDARGRVLPRNDPPTVNQTALVFTVKERQTFSVNLVDPKYIQDPNGDPLSFTLIDTASFIALSTDGVLKLTPVHKDIGDYVFKFTVTDNVNPAVPGTLTVHVIADPQPPVWAKDPIILPDATVELAYNQGLSQYVTDPNGEAIKITEVTGHPWAYLTSSGSYMGVPANSDLGVNTFKVRATNKSGLFADVTVIINVVTGSKPPLWTQDPIDLGTAVVGQIFQFDLTPYAKDPQNLPLTFKIVAGTGPTWLSTTQKGQLMGVPKTSDLGPYTVLFEISNGTSTAQAHGFGKVVDVQKPIWLQDPIRFTAKTEVLFSETIADKVTNPKPGTDLKFNKDSGPIWLSISQNGQLTGTPHKADLGENPFTVSVTNGQGQAIGHVIITVIEGAAPNTDTVRIDDPVPGARVDNLWVVDNSPTCSGDAMCLLYDVKKYINLYFKALEKAGIHHLGMYYAGDACAFTKPIRDTYGNLLISWEDGDANYCASSFNERLAMSAGSAKYNSPISQMVRFFRNVTSMSSLGDYYESEVPLETMIISAHPDQYKYFQDSGSFTAGWSLSKFVSFYQSQAEAAKKTLRTSAIAPKCPTTAYPSAYTASDTCTSYAAGQNAYKVVVDGPTGSTSYTKGVYYVYHDRMSVQDAFLDYADQVIFNTTVMAHRVIKLSKTPNPVSSIKVKLAGIELQGGTGGAADNWSYNSSGNSITLYWERIDRTGLKPGDKIEITYTTSGS